MTVPSTTNKSGPYSGNGVTNAFDYGFRIIDSSHIKVVLTTGGVDAVVDPGDYSVTGIGNVGGGQVVFDASPANGTKITLIRSAPFTQETDLENQGAYYAETIEAALDLATMRDQQLREEIDRSVKIPVSADASELDELIANIIRLSDSADAVDTVAGISGQVVTVAGIHADVTTVAGIAGDVSTVAAIAADVSTVADISMEVSVLSTIPDEIAGVYAIRVPVTLVAAINSDVTDVANIAANVTTVAGIEAEVAAVVGIAGNVTTVAGIAANITAVAAIDGDVSTVAGVSAQVQTVAGISAETAAVAAIDGDVVTVAANIADVQSAHQNAQDAIAAKNAAEAAAAGVNLPSIVPGDAGKFLRVKADETGREHITADVLRADIGLSEIGLFVKADPYAAAFTKTGNGTVSIKAGTLVEADGRIFKFTGATAVSMPALVAGTDYAIWIKPDGSLEATNDHVSPPLPGSRKLGGFHYAPGGNATALNTGGNAIAQVNEFSIWDLKFRPACPDPRGMALVAGKFWVDIYLCGVNHHSDGTSKYNVTIADGSSPPKVPAMFGGNGTTSYSSLNWWEAAEVMTSHGKELLSYEEFAAAAFGVKEAQAGGTDPVSTILRADYTSKWGIMLATGNLYVWSREFSYRQDGSGFAWEAVTGGRGGVYKQGTYGLVAALLGGRWDNASDAGSRASSWGSYPWNSSSNLGARGRSDHLNHV